MFTVLSIDYATLPPLFLSLAKSQSRVTHALDDALISEYIAQAIDDVERLTNATIFRRDIACVLEDLYPTRMALTPAPGTPPEGGGVRFALPFNNVESIAVSDGLGNDLTAQWWLSQSEVGGVATCWLNGTPGPLQWADVAIAFVAGMVTLETIAPALRRVILRRVAALYEFREATLPLSADDLASEPPLWRAEL